MVRRRFGISLAVACLLAACSAANGERTPSAALEAPHADPVQARSGEAQPQSSEALAPTDSSGAEIDRSFAELVPPAIAPAQRPATQLVGMSAGEITRLLGLPKMLRREPPAEVWQYASARCVVFVFLYEGKPAQVAAKADAAKPVSAARDWRVQYVETRSRADSRPVPAPDCLNGLIDRRPLALGEG